MKALLQKIGQEVWDRAVVSNKSTIIAWAIGVGVIVVDQVAQAVAGWHSPYSPVVGIAIGMIGTALKNKAAVAAARVKPVDPPPPQGFMVFDLMLVVGAALLLAVTFLAPRPAHAQSANPPDSAPLAVQLTPDLSLRLNVSVLAGSYDLTHKAWLGQAPITGLYALSSHRLLDAGVAVGGSLTFDTSSKPQGEINAGLVSPKIVISPTLALHAAVLYGRRFGSDPASLLRLAPTLEF